MRIEIHERGVTNVKAGLVTGETGIVDFPDDEKYRGWLNGQVARGAVSVVSDDVRVEAEALDQAAAEAAQHPDGETADVEPKEAPSAYSESALGPTSGAVPETSGPGSVDVDAAAPKPNDIVQEYADGAEGLTIGSTSGEPAPVFDEARDLADAEATQHPEKVVTQRGKPGGASKRRR